MNKRNSKVGKGILATSIATAILLGGNNNVFANYMPFPDTLLNNRMPEPQNGLVRIGKTLKDPTPGCRIDISGGYIDYNMETDLGLPSIGSFHSPINVGVTKGLDNIKDIVQRHWNYTVWETNRGEYNLYTENGEKWGICKPYFMNGGARQYRNPSRDITSRKLGWLYSANSPTTSIAILSSCDPDTAYSFIMYVPYSVKNNVVQNDINMVTSNGHLNGSLNKEDIEFRFTFY